MRCLSLSLAFLPVISFVAQDLLSRHAGTYAYFSQHFLAYVADWLFVPINYFLAKLIKWDSGKLIFLLLCISITINSFLHLFWQINELDGGHMIDRAGVILAAGWVHLIYSTIQTTLLMLYAFSAKQENVATFIASFIIAFYFSSHLIYGITQRGSFNISELFVFIAGTVIFSIYPSYKLLNKK